MCVNLYYTVSDKPLGDKLFASYLKYIQDIEQQKILKYHRWQDAQASLLGKLLLRHGLKRQGLNADLSAVKVNLFGKPFIDETCHFNISHSGPYVICGVTTDGRLGVDIEVIYPIELSDFQSHFSKTEWTLINTSPNKNRTFLKHWTIKEAIVKAVGKGLSIPLQYIELNDSGATMCDGSIWFYKMVLLGDDCVAHIALERPIDEIKLIRLANDDLIT